MIGDGPPPQAAHSPLLAEPVLLVIGVGAASMSTTFTRYADGAGSLAVSFWRCAGGAALLLPFAINRLPRMTRAEIRSSVVSGFFLAIHFAA